MQTEITTSEHGYEIGDLIEIRTPDTRWWKRLWYFVTIRPSPINGKRGRISQISNTTFLLR